MEDSSDDPSLEQDDNHEEMILPDDNAREEGMHVFESSMVNETGEENLGNDQMNVMPSDEEISNELESLEDLLVPVTVLSTKDDVYLNNPDIKPCRKSPRPKKATNNNNKIGRWTRNKSPRKKPVAVTQSSPMITLSSKHMLVDSMEGLTDNGEDDEEDEFEDERELEGGNKYGIRTEQERRRRPAVIITTAPHVSKRASLCLQEKVAIIKELELGEKQSWICKRKRLPKSTVQSIWKNRSKILEASEKIGMGRKRCRRAQHENIEDKLVEWIETLKSQNVPVNGPQLRAKAQVFAKQLGIHKFRSSTGWLDKFKTRHNISFKKSMKLNGNNHGIGDKKVAMDWVTKVWPSLCEGYAAENIFNADEFGLFYNALPDVVSKLMQETCHDGKMAEERLTVLLIANSVGTEKRPLTVIGSQNLIGHFNVQNLPVTYLSDYRSWMTRSIFVEELRKWDGQLRDSKRNVLLVVDNSPCHTITETFSNIKLVFLPPVVASVLQPLDHGIMDKVKAQYRRLLLDTVHRKFQMLTSNQPDKPSEEAINIMDAIVMLDAAWTSVSASSIMECFKNSNIQSTDASASTTPSLPKTKNTNKSDLDDVLVQQLVEFLPLQSVSFSYYNQIDTKLHITDYINDDHHPKNINTVGNFSLPETNIPTNMQVQEYLSSIRRWVMQLPANVEDRSIHESISILDNFVVKQNTNSNTGISNSETREVIFPLNNNNLSLTRASSQGHVGRVMLNGLSTNLSFGQQSNVLAMPPNGTANNGATVVTFTLTDNLQQANLPHHLMDQQQFFAYLT